MTLITCNYEDILDKIWCNFSLTACGFSDLSLVEWINGYNCSSHAHAFFP